MKSVQELQLHETNNEREISYPTTNNETLSLSSEEATKVEKGSPTQPKTLQQEFSLININIPNIEVC